jgi:hypothetical protein
MDFKEYEVWSEIFFTCTDSLSAKIRKYLDWQSGKSLSSGTVLHGVCYVGETLRRSGLS